MTRPYLDPQRVPASAPELIVERLPKPIREFGFYPNVDLLHAGDLILVCPVVLRGNAEIIQRVQGRRHTEFDAQWIHAAVYLGDNSLVEIAQSGVKLAELHKYVASHKILFRRALSLTGEKIDELTGYRIAVAALKAYETRYGFMDLLRVYRASGRWRSADERFRISAPEAICSDFFDAAVARVLGRGAASAKQTPFTPADLASSTNMMDLDVGWRQLPM